MRRVAVVCSVVVALSAFGFGVYWLAFVMGGPWYAGGERASDLAYVAEDALVNQCPKVVQERVRGAAVASESFWAGREAWRYVFPGTDVVVYAWFVGGVGPRSVLVGC